MIEMKIIYGIAALEIKNPPVNALGNAVRSELWKAIESLETDDDVKAVVIFGADKNFSAGADIREFGNNMEEPILPTLIDRVEACKKPVIASIHGIALGGGLELALGCHFRVALAGARMGLPEVNIGLLPGAGGTQRLPRLTGVSVACEMITTGRHINTNEASEYGVVDSVSSSDSPLEAGIEFAKKIVSESRPVVRTSSFDEKLKSESNLSELINKLREKVSKSRRCEVAPLKSIEAVELATELPFEQGMKKEREFFMELLKSEQSKGMIHAFMSERQVSKIPEVSESKPAEIESVGVVGGGTMGTGIAISHLLSGFSVKLIEKDKSLLGKCIDRVSSILEDSVKRGKLKAEAKAKILESRFSTSLDIGSISESDLVIEAVNEDLDLKSRIFQELDKTCKPDCKLASNTSYLNVNEIAKVTSRPDRVLGLHFFSPAYMMKLVEVVVADETSSETVATGFALARRLGKIAVRSGVCEGFVGNRIMSNYRKCAEYMVLDGASPYEIDNAVYEFGFPMGIFAVMDLAGLDINWAARKRLAPTRDKRERYVEFTDRICEKGWFGKKTKKGFYIYDEDSPKGRPNPEVEEMIENERRKVGLTKHSYSSDEIIRRYMAAMINESAKVLSDGIALRPSDIDVVMLLGYGFPRWRGGPLNYADSLGLDKIMADITEFENEDGYFWQCSDLLKKLADTDQNFKSLNK